MYLQGIRFFFKYRELKYVTQYGFVIGDIKLPTMCIECESEANERDGL